MASCRCNPASSKHNGPGYLYAAFSVGLNRWAHELEIQKQPSPGLYLFKVGLTAGSPQERINRLNRPRKDGDYQYAGFRDWENLSPQIKVNLSGWQSNNMREDEERFKKELKAVSRWVNPTPFRTDAPNSQPDPFAHCPCEIFRLSEQDLKEIIPLIPNDPFSERILEIVKKKIRDRISEVVARSFS
jgi:hypothetical protein